MSNVTLFELTNQYKSLQALIDSEEMPDELIRDTIDGLTGDFEQKCKNVAYVVLHLKAMAEAIASAAQAMMNRAEMVQHRSDRLKQYLLFALQATDITKIDLPEMVIRRQNNPPSVVIATDEHIPPEFWIQPEPPPPHPDKKKLKEAIQAGREIAGVYVEQGEHLRIVL